MPRPRAVVVVTAALVALACVGTGCLLVARPALGAGGALMLAVMAVGLATTLLGVAVAFRAPANHTATALTAVGAGEVLLAVRDVYYRAALEGGPPLDVRVVAFLDESGWWLLVAVSMVVLLFPDGRLPSARWRPVAVGLFLTAGAHQLLMAFATEPFGGPVQDLPRPFAPLPPYLQVLDLVVFLLMLGLFLASCAAVVLRLRAAGGVRRQQLKWLSLAAVAILLYPLVCLAEIVLTGRSGAAAASLGLVALLALPVAVAVAMLRHDLYDVDRLLAATITYALVSAVLLAGYVAATAVLGLLVGADSAPVAALAAAAAALALTPLRRRVQRVVEGRLSPTQRAVRATLADLEHQVIDGTAQPEELEDRLRSTLGDASLRVGVRAPSDEAFTDLAGRPVAVESAVPVTLGGTTIGLLSSASDGSRAVLRRVVPDLARTVEVVRLRTELAAAVRDVNDSRARLVHATNAERKRLERDLHDGAQQRLVSLGVAVRVAQRHLGDGTVVVDALLDQVVTELQTAIAELRNIAHGLRPTSLEDGLEPALVAVTHTLPLPIRLDISPEPLPDDLALTAYFVASEAVANAAKHAEAQCIEVKVENAPDGVRVRVEDDGRGGARPGAGSGLTGLHDRVTAAGGVLTVISPRGGGTVVEAVLPCGS